ncbi:MAG TPA: acylphosphatase [Terriglobia bacterium]|jgi:acylphosphatase|nr:acylphosphatase [Terriglobia bacterium]
MRINLLPGAMETRALPRMRPRAQRVAKKYRISGRVQGVGFRYFAERAAHGLGLGGYVRNCPDGTVEVYAIGEPSTLEVFRLQLAEGPRSARVAAVEERDEPVNDVYAAFRVEGVW